MVAFYTKNQFEKDSENIIRCTLQDPLNRLQSIDLANTDKFVKYEEFSLNV